MKAHTRYDLVCVDFDLCADLLRGRIQHGAPIVPGDVRFAVDGGYRVFVGFGA